MFLRYMAANQRCKFAEDTIQTETENMEQLSKMVEEKFSEVRTLTVSVAFSNYEHCTMLHEGVPCVSLCS